VVTDVSAYAALPLWAVNTLLTKIHVSLATWNVATMLRSVSTVLYLLIPFPARLSSEKATPRFTFSKMRSYQSCSISLILPHMFAQWLIPLSISTSLRSQQAYAIFIQLIPAIVLHLHNTLLCPLSELLLSLFVKFIWYMNRAFSSDTNPVMSSGVQEVEQGQTSERWLQSMLLVVVVMNSSAQSTNQSA